jgi:hypothetical protein
MWKCENEKPFVLSFSFAIFYLSTSQSFTFACPANGGKHADGMIQKIVLPLNSF